MFYYVGIMPICTDIYTSMIAAGLHLARQICMVDLDDPTSCSNTFLSNASLGGIMTLGVFLDRFLC